MKKIYIREYYFERDDWACNPRKRFVLEVNSVEAAKRWIIDEVDKWKKEGKSREFSIVECDEKEFRIGDPELYELKT